MIEDEELMDVVVTIPKSDNDLEIVALIILALTEDIDLEALEEFNSVVNQTLQHKKDELTLTLQ